MEQKCTIKELVKILNKITRAFGYGWITEIKINHDFGSITYKIG